MLRQGGKRSGYDGGLGCSFVWRDARISWRKGGDAAAWEPIPAVLMSVSFAVIAASSYSCQLDGVVVGDVH